MTKLASYPIIFTDFDGTLYDLGPGIVLSPYYNVKTTGLLRKMNAQFVIVTGRSLWRKIDELQLRLLGLPLPDIIIYGAGTHILRKTKEDKYEKDTLWEDKIAATEIVWMDTMAKPHPWQKNLIEETLQPTLADWHLSYKRGENPYMIEIPITNLQVKQVKRILDQLQMTFRKGIKLLLTEKLYLPNSIDLFNGYLLLVPESAGKETASRYILEENRTQRPDALFFGDALVDVPMLAMDTNMLTNASFSYGVHMTPLALENLIIEDPKSKIVHRPGSAPKAFYEIIKAYAKGSPIAAQQHAKIVEPA